MDGVRWSALCIPAWFHDKWRDSGDGKVQRGTSVLLIILAAAGGWRLTAAALCGWSRRLQTGAAQTDTHQPHGGAFRYSGQQVLDFLILFNIK